MDQLLRIALSLLPVIVFFVSLVYLDSYKLVNIRAIVLTIAVGSIAAIGAFFINSWALDFLLIDRTIYTRYCAPVVEETLKMLFVIYLIQKKKVGFMVDAAIRGFAIGAGFATFENIYYLSSLETANLFVWVIRGFGTAIMHGGTTCIFAVVSKNLMDVHESGKAYWYIPGILAVIIIHSFFNHLFFTPMINTAIIIIALPSLMMTVYQRSERGTQNWLGVGFDADAQILNMIVSGNIAASKIGAYLASIKDRFEPEVVLDIFCYLRIYLELAVQAKGILLMRETGFDADPDPGIQKKISELTYLEKSIGRTGKIALSPFIRTNSRDLWQLQMLQK
jgi:protease PrsW